MAEGYSILVCDDDENDLSDVCDKIEKCSSGRKLNILRFSSGQRVLETAFSRKEAPWAAIVDIELEGGIRGFQVIDHIRKFRTNVIPIIITAHDGYLDDMMDCQVFRYIRKPVEPGRLNRVMEDAFQKIYRWDRSWLFSVADGMIRLSSDEILCCEADGKGTILHTIRGVIRTMDPFGTCCRKLQGTPFVKTHRSYLVNLQYVRQYDHRTVLLEAPVFRRVQNKSVPDLVTTKAYMAYRSYYRAFCEKIKQYWCDEG